MSGGTLRCLDLNIDRHAEKRRNIIDCLGLFDDEMEQFSALFPIIRDLEFRIAAFVEPLIKEPAEILARRLFHRYLKIMCVDILIFELMNVMIDATPEALFP